MNRVETAIETLRKGALIKREGECISLRPPMQTVFRYSHHGILDKWQNYFDAAVALVLDHIPITPGTTSHAGKWDQCNI